MKISSFVLAGPLALATILSTSSSTGVLAATPKQATAGPLPYGGSSREAALKSADKPKPTKPRLSSAAYVDRSYIVELDPSAAKGSKRDSSPHDAVHEHLTRRGKKGSYKTRYEWNNAETFVGMSVVLNSDDDYEALQNAPGVKGIWRNNLYNIAAFEPTVASESFVRASVSGQSSAASTEGARVGPPSGAEAGVKDTFSPHVMTGVDKLHAQGYFGQGQVVGVIDTGIDYTHPGLGGKPGFKPCFGEGCKVIGGYDFVGDKYDGTNDPVPDSDPFSGCNGHGTHVAGTIAANDTNLGFTGVAPHAKLRAYRVFGCSGSVSDDVLIASLQRAYFDGNDIISLSIGGPGGWPQTPSGAVASRIVELGTPVIAANGNDGAFGTYYASGLANGKGVTAVGSVNNVQLTGYGAKVIPSGLGKDTLTYLTGTPFSFDGSSTLEVYATSTNLNVADDACAPLPDSTPDLSNKVVVVGRGTCPFATKFQNVFAKGGKTVLVYNTPAPASITYVETSIEGQQAASLTREDGQFLVKLFAAGTKVSLDFSDKKAFTIPDTTSGGIMSSFSQYTPNYENTLLPQVSAPGGNILSTWPIALGQYTIISGTSMATPFVAGSYAVYRASHGGKTKPETLRTLFGSTGTPLKQTRDNSTQFETLVKQGSGLINVFDAMYQDVTYSPRAIELNDTDHFVGEHTIKVKNHGKSPRKYTLKHEPVGTAQSIEDDSTVFFNTFPVPLTTQFAAVSLSKTKLVVPPGGEASFKVKITPPKGVKAEKLPLYSGYVHLIPESKKYTGLRVPYAGVVGSLNKAKVLDNTDELFGFQLPVIVDPKDNPVTDDAHVFSLADNTTRPTLIYRFAFGTPFYQIDLVAANTTFKPTIPILDGSTNQRRSLDFEGSAGFIRRKAAHQHVFQRAAEPEAETEADATTAKKSKKPAATTVNQATLKFADVKTIGTVYKESWVGRNSQTGLADDYSFSGQTLTRKLFLPQGGSLTIPDGEYRLLLRAQKPFSKGTLEKDYESYLSHKFTVKA